eukprot:TRINITY_DN3300_c0_g1_i2.p1 TRINITY_DN3300_c0_g1~~TRINITY_DN3300_c0_g1_i2.p1  ORF type:complete len:103 (-),score=42.87 TRINITY_DN3300_c0_g1_i2:595-903(-)
MIRRPPRSTQSRSSAASDVYKRQEYGVTDRDSMALEALNQLSQDSLLQELLKCCNSQKWAAQVVKVRPFTDLSDLLAKSDVAWSAASREDCLQAMRHCVKLD